MASFHTKPPNIEPPASRGYAYLNLFRTKEGNNLGILTLKIYLKRLKRDRKIIIFFWSLKHKTQNKTSYIWDPNNKIAQITTT